MFGSPFCPRETGALESLSILQSATCHWPVGLRGPSSLCGSNGVWGRAPCHPPGRGTLDRVLGVGGQLVHGSPHWESMVLGRAAAEASLLDHQDPAQLPPADSDDNIHSGSGK